MPQPSFFAFKGGTTSVEEIASANGFGLMVKTRIPAVNLGVQSRAHFDDKGLTSFTSEVVADTGTVIYRGQLSPEGFRVEFHGMGFHGNALFERDSYDLTTFDLMVLEKDDVADVETGTSVRVLDPIEMEIHRASVSSTARRTGDVAQPQLTLDFEGEVHRLDFDPSTFEVTSGISAGERWERVSPVEAIRHTRSLRR